MTDVDDRPTRHIVFHRSAREPLLEYLRSLERQDEVVVLDDDFQCGPLDVFDRLTRKRWLEETLGLYAEASGGADRAESWAMALDGRSRLIAWTSRHSGQEWLGFLVWAARLGDACAEVVDVSEIRFTDNDWRSGPRKGRLPIPMLTPELFSRHRLIEQARPLSASDHEEATRELRRLANEDGAFRVMEDGRPVSLPITGFDEALVASADDRWRKAAYVIGTTLIDLIEQKGWGIGDHVLAARLAALVKLGRLEAVGNISAGIGWWEVRRPRARGVSKA